VVTRAKQPEGWYPLLLAAASIGVANSVVFTLLSDLQDKYHFSDAGLGLIAGTGFLVGLVGQIFIAPYADQGHAKRLLIIGLMLAVVGNVCFALSSTLLTLVLSRAVVGLSNSVFFPASRAIVFTMSPTDELGARLGTISGIELAGFVTGPVIGGLLVDPFGIKVPFLVCGTFALAGAIMLGRSRLPEPPIGERHRVALDLLRLPKVRAGVLFSIALFVPVGFYDAILDRYLTDMGASNQLISLAFLAFGIPFALLATRGGRLADRRGPLRMAFIATMLVAPITFIYGFITVPIVFILLGIVEGTVQSVGIPANSAVITNSAPEGRVASAQGLAGAGNLLMGAAAAYLAGTLYESLGSRWVFTIAAVGVALFGLLAALQVRRATQPDQTRTLS
jgi:predicted MFS family arabinose efflux permease